MRWNQIKGLLILLSGLILTSFVTACVKNGSKDQGPTQQPLKTLDASALSKEQLSGDTELVIVDQSEIPAVQVVKEYNFEVEDIRELTVRRGAIANEQCQSEGLSLPKMILISPDGTEKQMKFRRKAELLTPGSYRLRVTINNDNLCRNIKVAVHLSGKQRDDLVLTQKEDRGYQCYVVEQDGKLKPKASVRLNTHPLRVVQFSQLNEGVTNEVQLATEQRLCGAIIATNTQCSENLTPALQKLEPITAVQKNCRSTEQRHSRSHALLQINGSPSSPHAEFTCRNKGKVSSLKLDECELLFNIGQALPVRLGQTDVVFRKNRMRVNFETLYSQIEEKLLPQELYVGLAREVDQNYYEPVLNSFQSISKDDILDGHVTLREHNLINKVLAGRVNDLRLVFSRRPNLKHGLYYLNFSKLCTNESNSIIGKVNSAKEQNLCE